MLYLAHDLDDSAIWRRVAMLDRGGAEVAVAGFRRGAGPVGGATGGRIADRLVDGVPTVLDDAIDALLQPGDLVEIALPPMANDG